MSSLMIEVYFEYCKHIKFRGQNFCGSLNLLIQECIKFHGYNFHG